MVKNNSVGTNIFRFLPRVAYVKESTNSNNHRNVMKIKPKRAARDSSFVKVCRKHVIPTLSRCNNLITYHKTRLKVVVA